MRVVVLALAAALMAAAPALAQTEPAAIPTSPLAAETTSQAPTGNQTPDGAAVEPSNDGGEEICRTFQRAESRLRSRRERICHTRAEWEQMERDAAELVRGTGVQGTSGN